MGCSTFEYTLCSRDEFYHSLAMVPKLFALGKRPPFLWGVHPGTMWRKREGDFVGKWAGMDGGA